VEQRQGPQLVAGGAIEVTPAQVDVAEIAQHVGLAGPVADRAEQAQGLPEVVSRRLVAALPSVDGAQ
jgi:hypothetical protein